MSQLSVSHLRPLSMGEILDRAIRLYRHNFLKFLGLAALAQIPATLISLLPALLGGPDLQLQNPLLFVLITFSVTGFIVLLTQVVAGVLVHLVTDAYLGKSTTVAEGFGKIRNSWLMLIRAQLSFGLRLLLFLLFLIIPIVGWLAALPGFGLYLYALFVVLPLITPVVMLESRPAWQTARRAWELARQRFWWMLGFFLLLGLFSSLFSLGPGLFLAGVARIAVSGVVNATVLVVVQAVITALFGTIYFPIQIACVTLAYFDLRIRYEGLDLALQAIADEGNDPTPAFQQTPGWADKRWLTGSEIGRFLLIVLVLSALAFIFSTTIAAFLLPFLNSVR